jgi:hypothetical protein
MPIHNWKRVESGIFHDFHHAWIEEIKRALNRGILPPDHYALAEQIAGNYGPDVLTLEGPIELPDKQNHRGGVALAEVQPIVSYRLKTHDDIYAAKAYRVAIHHVTGHHVVAVIEIVSPGNKNTLTNLRKFTEKAADLLRNGIHLLVIDPFPPGRRDPQGIHKAIWDELDDSEFQLPQDRPLTLASYTGGLAKEAFIEPVAVGAALPDMPLFLTPDIYVLVPLEQTYQAAFDAVPAIFRKRLTSSTN